MEKEQVIENVVEGAGFLISIPRLVASGFLLITGILIVFITFVSSSYLIDYKHATPTIVDIKSDSESENYYPIYEYEYEGEMVQVQGKVSEEKKNIKIGSQIEILYSPYDYTHIDTVSKKSIIIKIVIGSILIIVSIISIHGFFKSLKKYIISKLKGKYYQQSIK